jgi:hypothetical protein
MAPSEVASDSITGKKEIQFPMQAFGRNQRLVEQKGEGLESSGAEKKQSHFWLCFERRVGLKSFSKRAKS